jgi:hypothetical protein
MVIFHSYVDLPEGIWCQDPRGKKLILWFCQVYQSQHRQLQSPRIKWSSWHHSNSADSSIKWSRRPKNIPIAIWVLHKSPRLKGFRKFLQDKTFGCSPFQDSRFWTHIKPYWNDTIFIAHIWYLYIYIIYEGFYNIPSLIIPFFWGFVPF